MQIQFISSKVFENTLHPWNKNGETVKKQSEKERFGKIKNNYENKKKFNK